MQNKLTIALFVLIVVAFIVFTIVYGQAAWQMQLWNDKNAAKECGPNGCPIDYSKPIMQGGG